MNERKDGRKGKKENRKVKNLHQAEEKIMSYNKCGRIWQKIKVHKYLYQFIYLTTMHTLDIKSKTLRKDFDWLRSHTLSLAIAKVRVMKILDHLEHFSRIKKENCSPKVQRDGCGWSRHGHWKNQWE